MMQTTTITLTQDRLHGLTALVVEDETIISFLIEDMLRDLGCTTIWHSRGTDQALHLIEERAPAIAVLDVNLGRDSVDPIAERLDRSGIPFIFSTGYGRGGVPQLWNGHPVLQKPFLLHELAGALRAALALAEKRDSR